MAKLFNLTRADFLRDPTTQNAAAYMVAMLAFEGEPSVPPFADSMAEVQRVMLSSDNPALDCYARSLAETLFPDDVPQPKGCTPTQPQKDRWDDRVAKVKAALLKAAAKGVA